MKRTLFLFWLAALPATLWAAAVEDPAGLEQLRQSAERGDAAAMLEVGILYEFGFRMPDNKAPALAWYRLAAQAGNAKAGARYDALRPSLSAKEIDEADKLYAELAANQRKSPASSNNEAPSAATVPAVPAETAPKQDPKQN